MLKFTDFLAFIAIAKPFLLGWDNDSTSLVELFARIASC